LILVETEFWPNLICEAKAQGCFLALINGRISDRSLKRYLLVQSLFKQTLSCFDLLCVQSGEHKEKICRLGADPHKIRVTGNLKFDRLLYVRETMNKSELKEKLGIPDGFQVIMGGSVRQGEERILVDVFKRLKLKQNNLLMVLAPRHLDRLRQMERFLSDQGMKFIRKSKLDDKSTVKYQDVILLDTMGELSGLYAMSDVAFVGGSLVPVGGHNLLEPAIHGVPVIFGPFIDHFREEAKILMESGGGIKVRDREELYSSLHELLSDRQKRIRLGEKAREVLQKETGVSQRTTELIFSFLLNYRPLSTVRRPQLTPDQKQPLSAKLLLSFFSMLYGFACLVRLSLYRLRLIQQKRLNAKVISVGNITVGGTGKTPLVIYLGDALKTKGRKVAVLSRGYKRKYKAMFDLNENTFAKASWEEVGDEPYLLSKRLIDIPIIVTKHRTISGPYAVEKYGTEILILDDGFQHLKLKRDLDILVIDSTNPFGNGKLLPAGILREPLSALKRADVFVLTKTDQIPDIEKLKELLGRNSSKTPVVETVYRVRSIERLSDSSAVDLKEVENKKALAFSGIGNPESFGNSLKQQKIDILKHRIFPDHFIYRPKDILSLAEEAGNLGADFMITTEKDSVRIPKINPKRIPVYVLMIDLEVTSGEETFLRIIEDIDKWK
jgi:tetraacyldisaccharide 4'-kinase